MSTIGADDSDRPSDLTHRQSDLWSETVPATHFGLPETMISIRRIPATPSEGFPDPAAHTSTSRFYQDYGDQGYRFLHRTRNSASSQSSIPHPTPIKRDLLESITAHLDAASSDVRSQWIFCWPYQNAHCTNVPTKDPTEIRRNYAANVGRDPATDLRPSPFRFDKEWFGTSPDTPFSAG
jgi:hypothetical protein